MLSDAARRYLEALVKLGTYEYEYQSDFVRKYIFQGRAEGRADGERRAVLAVLKARDIAVPDAVRQRIEACTDLDQLDIWVERAGVVSTVDELFA